LTPSASIHRIDKSSQGTFGHLVAGGLALFSGELPWKDNARTISCIPLGVYPCAFTYSPKFGRYLYLVAAAPPRAGIRIHPANLAGDTTAGFLTELNGCIALGEKLGYIDNQKALLSSASAVRRLEEYFGGRPFLLEIYE